jgi:hypothetical protein
VTSRSNSQRFSRPYLPSMNEPTSRRRRHFIQVDPEVPARPRIAINVDGSGTGARLSAEPKLISSGPCDDLPCVAATKLILSPELKLTVGENCFGAGGCARSRRDERRRKASYAFFGERMIGNSIETVVPLLRRLLIDTLPSSNRTVSWIPSNP